MTEPAARGPARGTSYAEAGVSIEAGDRAVDLMRGAIAQASRPEVVGGVGGFAGLFDASRLTRFTRPLLATSTDGVGTKVMIAARLGQYATIGLDLVASLVDDVVTCGAEPWFMTDYLVCGVLRPERAAAIVGGVARGCAVAGCALIGGETAEHPGHLGADDFDLAGAATGVVEADRLLGPHRVQAGDVVIGLAASGLHANGYSLARRVLADAGLALEATPPELSQAVGAELLTPSTIYAPDCLALAARTSPGAGWRPIWPGCCRRGWAPRWTAAPGSRRRSSACWPGWAGSRRMRWSGCSTWGSG
jgi:phosphoribosylformylglycinamidine cyclo-ligase